RVIRRCLAATVIGLSLHHAHRTHPHWHPTSQWKRQAACIRHYESRGRWTTNTGNGYYGAYQFLLSTWRSVGGRSRPDLAAPREQSSRAWRVWKRDGRSWREWGTASLCDGSV